MKGRPPILLNKHYTEPTVFTVDNLLREARRQKSLPQEQVPSICLLDPDGDIVRWLVRIHGIARPVGLATILTCIGSPTKGFNLVSLVVLWVLRLPFWWLRSYLLPVLNWLSVLVPRDRLSGLEIHPTSFSLSGHCVMKGPVIIICLRATSVI